jgi:hypothetical protein
LSTADTIASLGRFNTHSPVRNRFCEVFEWVASPSMQRHPSQNAEDIGARLGVPSSLSVLISTTGVPKYKMAGSMRTCMRGFLDRVGR